MVPRVNGDQRRAGPGPVRRKTCRSRCRAREEVKWFRLGGNDCGRGLEGAEPIAARSRDATDFAARNEIQLQGGYADYIKRMNGIDQTTMKRAQSPSVRDWSL